MCVFRYSRRELANVLEVSGDEQFRSTILMLKLFETNTRSALREIHAKLALLAQGPRSTGAAVHASIYRYVLHIDVCYDIYHEYVCVCVCTHISLMGPVCALQVPMPYVSTYLYIPTYLIHGCSCMYKCMHVQGWWGRPARMVMDPASVGGRSRAEMSRRRRRAWKRAKRTLQPWLSGWVFPANYGGAPNLRGAAEDEP